MDVGPSVQGNELQKNLPVVESTLCSDFQTTSEQSVEKANGDLNQQCHLNSKETDPNAIPQMGPANQEELNTKTACEQSSAQHILPAVQPELCVPNSANISAMLFAGQTPANVLNTKLTGLFNVPTPFVGQVRNPLTYVAPIVRGSIQPTAVTSIRMPMESSTVRLANMCSKLPIVQASSLPTKLSSTGPSYEQSASAVVGSFGATDQTVPHVQYQLCTTEKQNKVLPLPFTQTTGQQLCSTHTETASSTATLLNSTSTVTPVSLQSVNSHLRQAQMLTESCTATSPNTQCIYTNTGSGNQATTLSIAKTQPQLVPVPSAKSQPEQPSTSKNTNVPVPVIPEFQSGKVDAKKFRPRYYDMDSLEIGTWKYQREVTFFPRGKSRLKVIFSQRKFVYEFVLDTNLRTGDVPMACIEVPFRTVVGLNVATSPTVDVIIEVDTLPAMMQGMEVRKRGRDGVASNRVEYNTYHTVDLTGGQLSKVPYHKLTLSSTSVTIRNHLMKFDPRFSALLKIPVKIDSNKPPPAALLPDMKPKRKRDSTSEETPDLEPNPKSQRCTQTNKTLTSLKGCSCTSGCSSKRCNCIKGEKKCQGCSCTSCDNPLNILEDSGVNLDEACKDSCLMQNLPKISNLRALLRNSKVATPCCESLIPLSDCCSGEVECPECDAEYRFSWCSRDLCDEEDRPRNHCAICQTCRDYRDQHCSRCNTCYFAGSYGFPCPCRGGNQRGRSFMGFMF